MSLIFGPVQSRRLGRSLGIDVIPPKTCNWNCVYCQLGRTTPVTNIRRQYSPTDALGAEIREALRTFVGEVDWITFVGSGEPTLHIQIGTLIRTVKNLTDIPVAVITNGSLLYVPAVARDLQMADAVLPSLDAGNELLFRTINRPHPQVRYDRYRHGLAQFRQSYKGLFWLEVMLIAGLNDDERSLTELSSALSEIAPDEVHVSTPFRVPAEPWVRQPCSERIALAKRILGENCRVLMPVAADANLVDRDPVEAIIDVILRHPLSDEELRSTLTQSMKHPESGLIRLAHDSRVKKVRREGAFFWCAAAGVYEPQANGRSRTEHDI